MRWRIWEERRWKGSRMKDLRGFGGTSWWLRRWKEEMKVKKELYDLKEQ